MFRVSIFFVLFLFYCGKLNIAQDIIDSPDVLAPQRRTIIIPDILGYKTLKSDMHMHTVFSDGQVWPTVRIDEAWREGLDVISITEHVGPKSFPMFMKPGTTERPEYLPDHNIPYDITKNYAEQLGIILIKGAEITWDMPPGHHNALFLTDINKIHTSDWQEAMIEAKNQGAFMFWNHPCWVGQQPDTVKWMEEHTWIYENGMMHGIEVASGTIYCPDAHQWAVEKGLTFISNSDVHAPILMHKQYEQQLRPMTLVFTKEKSSEGVREAIFEGRTLAYNNYNLIGKSKYLNALFLNSIRIESVEIDEKGFRIIINNPTDIPFLLSKAPGNNPSFEFFDSKLLPAREQTIIIIHTNQPLAHDKIDLKVNVDNLLIAPETGLPVTLKFIP